MTHSDAAIQYAPPTNFAGWDSFSASVSADNGSASQTAWVQAENRVPQAQPAAFSTAPNETVSGTLSATDPDSSVRSENLSYQLAVRPSHGKLNFHADGTFAYTPALGFAGSDRFSFLGRDAIAAAWGCRARFVCVARLACAVERDWSRWQRVPSMSRLLSEAGPS